MSWFRRTPVVPPPPPPEPFVIPPPAPSLAKRLDKSVAYARDGNDVIIVVANEAERFIALAYVGDAPVAIVTAGLQARRFLDHLARPQPRPSQRGGHR